MSINEDKIWSWKGWHVFKWITGILILWFILIQVWIMSVDKNYPNNMISEIKNYKFNKINLDFKLFDSTRAIR